MSARLKWGVERRLRFIEFRLFWEGRLNRSDLVNYFKISVPQASTDISMYRQLGPRNMEYDRVQKTYVVRADFDPVFAPPDVEEYLSRLVSYGVATQKDAWIGALPPVDTVPYPKRKVGTETLRIVLDAIASSEAIEIKYQSLSRPEPSVRWITPHALAYDGHRWHARAFCHLRVDFRDFVLGRILKLIGRKPHAIDPLDDRAWQEQVLLLLGTHKGLTEAQRRAVELEYGMKDGQSQIRVRAALTYYIKRWLRLDLDPDQVPAERQQIVLLNHEEVDSRVAELQGRT